MKIFARSVTYSFVSILVLSFSLTTFAQQNPLTPAQIKEKMAKDQLTKYAEQQKRQNYTWPSDALGISEVYSDRLLIEMSKRQLVLPLNLQEQTNELIDVLIKQDNKNPIVVGESGVGKSELIRQATYDLLTENFPDGKAYQDSFKNVAVLKISGRRFIPGGYDLHAVIEGIRAMAKDVRKIVLVIYESHFLNDYAISVLRENLEVENPLPIILETDSKSYGQSIKGHPSFTKIAHTILVSEPKKDQVKDILIQNVAPGILERYNVKLSDALLTSLVDVAPEFQKDTPEPRRSLTLAEEFAINWQRNRPSADKNPSKEDLFRFVAHQARLPVIPQNEEEFVEYMSKVRERVKSRVVGQERIVDGLVDQFIAALTSRNRQHSVALIMGPTGVGKTLSAEMIGEEFYGDKTRIKELDMTQFGDASGLNTLFGAPNGYISSDKEKGVLSDFFDGPGRGGGVLILNEIEEASGDVFTRFMEMFDKGEFRGGDGQVRYLGRTLIVLTSNKNTDKIISYDSIKGMSKSELNRRLSLITEEQLKKAFTEKASYTDDSSKVVKTAVLERLDRVYFASPLLLDDAIKVTQIEVDKYVKDYNSKGKATLEVDSSFAQVLTGAFYREAFGARQIRTAVQQTLTKAVQDYKAKYGFRAEKLKVKAELHPSQKTVSYVTVSSQDDSKSIQIDGPSIPVDNKLFDKEFRQRLIDLEKNLNSEVFGQEDAIKALVSSIQGRVLRGGKEDLVVGFLLGTTGAGKSQLAKSTAKYLYGRDDAYAIFEMGRVKDEIDLYNIFSPPKGIIGSDQPGELEKFLIQHPDGGVLLFDEMSNAGGNNIQLKNSIAKQFYTLFQEGYYKSPSGKVFDLSKYVVILTGNDGEEIFRGATSDSMLEQAYKEATKKPEQIRDILRRAGFSDAFLGRLSFAALMKPTLGNVKTMIAKKMINEWRLKVEAAQPLDLDIDENAALAVGRLMFSPQSGARSINHFVSSVLGQAVSSEALKLDWDDLIKNGTRRTIRIRISTVEADSYFYEETPFKSSATLTAELMNGDVAESKTEVDFSSQANFKAQVSLDSARATAYHEMGHAVTSFTDVTGKQIVKITVIPEKLQDGRSALGYAQYESVPTNKEHANHEFMIKTLAGLLAGSEAEQRLGKKISMGRSDDVKRAGDLARRMILEHHLLPELDAAQAYVDKDGHVVNNLPDRLKNIFDDAVQKAIDEARQLAIDTINARWPLIEEGSALLLKNGNISQEEYQALEKKHEAASASATCGEFLN